MLPFTFSWSLGKWKVLTANPFGSPLELHLLLRLLRILISAHANHITLLLSFSGLLSAFLFPGKVQGVRQRRSLKMRQVENKNSCGVCE